MHNDSTEPSEGAAQVVSRPLCKCHGVPCFTNGITYGKQRWRCSVKALAANRISAANNPEPRRARAKAWTLANRDRRREHGRNYRRRQLGWFAEGGMATKPTQFKEITNG